MAGAASRDKLWGELYFSKELQKAAKYLIPNGDLWQDLLSDALVKVLCRDDFDQWYNPKIRLENYVFIAMRNMAYSPEKEWLRNLGACETEMSVSINGKLRDAKDRDAGERVYFPREFFTSGLADGYSGDGDEIEVTNSEVDYSLKIFGVATKSTVELMREIDRCDGLKETDRSRWEAAQYTKIYLERGSTRKAAEAIGVSHHTVWAGVKRFTSSLTNDKMKITVVTYEKEPKSGMELYRLHYPYFQGVSKTEGFSVNQVSYSYIGSQPAPALESDVYVFSRLQFPEIADKVIEAGKKLVVDLDDYLKLHKEHPKHGTEENKRYVSNVTYALKKAHLVTTTTEQLAQRCREELDIDPVVIKNTIPEKEEQFSGEALPHSKVRFLYMGGVFHHHDILQMYEGFKKLYSDPHLKEKFQLCLAGFNPNSEYVAYEKVFTVDYKGFPADSDYVDYLKMYTPALDHLSYYKPYRRIWARPVSQYGIGYREGDVCLIPLAGGIPFNECKSELKLIEAGMTGKAAIVSDVLPYSPHLFHEDNCLKVSPSRRDWFTQMRRMIVDKELREELAANLSGYVRKEFNHQKEVSKLTNALKKLKA